LDPLVADRGSSRSIGGIGVVGVKTSRESLLTGPCDRAPKASFVGSVTAVVRIGPREEVARSHASRPIAGMAYDQASRNRAKGNLERDHIGASISDPTRAFLSTLPESAVPAFDYLTDLIESFDGARQETS
jgi:hypothetical protein